MNAHVVNVIPSSPQPSGRHKPKAVHSAATYTNIPAIPIAVTSNCGRGGSRMPNEHDIKEFLAAGELTDMRTAVRYFPGGATRDLADGKPDIHRFLCPRVLTYYIEQYMMPHQNTAAGRREADNWKTGFGVDVLMASLTRHYWEVWRKWDKGQHDLDRPHREEMLQDLCGVLFNTMAMMREMLDAD